MKYHLYILEARSDWSTFLSFFATKELYCFLLSYIEELKLASNQAIKQHDTLLHNRIIQSLDLIISSRLYHHDSIFMDIASEQILMMVKILAIDVYDYDISLIREMSWESLDKIFEFGVATYNEDFILHYYQTASFDYMVKVVPFHSFEVVSKGYENYML